MKKTANKPSFKTGASVFFKVMKYLKKYRLLFALSLLLTAVVVGLTLYVPILIGNAIDLALGKENVNLLGILS